MRVEKKWKWKRHKEWLAIKQAAKKEGACMHHVISDKESWDLLSGVEGYVLAIDQKVEMAIIAIRS